MGVLAPAKAPESRLRRPTNPSTGETTLVSFSVTESSSRRACVETSCALATVTCDTAELYRESASSRAACETQAAIEAGLRAVETVLAPPCASFSRATTVAWLTSRLALTWLTCSRIWRSSILTTDWPARHAVAELDEHRLDAAGHARHDVHRGLADEIADHGDVVDDLVPADVSPCRPSSSPCPAPAPRRRAGRRAAGARGAGRARGRRAASLAPRTEIPRAAADSGASATTPRRILRIDEVRTLLA